MGPAEISAFLSALAVRDKVAASTQNQALSALLFLYRDVLGVDLPWLDDVVRAKRPQYLPVVLTREETRAVLQQLTGVPRIMALLLYGAGLRLLECCRLRVKDVDFATNQIVIRDGKGRKDRVTMLPAAVKTLLMTHLDHVRTQHQADLRRGAGWVELPGALLRKYPSQARHVSHPSPFLRHPPAGGQPRHPDRPGAPRPPRCQHHDDLHARPQPGPSGRPKPRRPDVPVVILPGPDVEPAAGAEPLASDASQDIWAHVTHHIAQCLARAGFFLRRPWCAARIHRTVRKHRLVQATSR
jgi:hypothetical protein